MWHEIQIKRIKLYNQFLKPYVDAGKMGCSSSCFPATRRVKKSGEITQWVASESTGTFVPADTRQVGEQPFRELKRAFKSIGVDIPVDNEDGFIKSLELDSDKLDSLGDSEANGVEKTRLSLLLEQTSLELKAISLEI